VTTAVSGFAMACYNRGMKRTYIKGHRTHAEIAKMFGISRSRVKQLERGALAKLRRSPILRTVAAELGILLPDPGYNCR
jgi:hypothetical protein